MQKTKFISKENLIKSWFLVDASNLVLGRLASKIIPFLLGTNLPIYTPNQDCGSNIIVINSSKIHLTGNKWKNKLYYSHSQYPGGLKVKSAKVVFDRDPNKLIWLAVKRMIPKNKLGSKQLNSLYIYENDIHPHEGQKPKKIILN